MDKGADSYRKFLDGDREGMAELVHEYREGLTFYLYRITNNIDTAEELMEETFARIYAKKPDFSGKSSFKTWLYSIGRNTAYNIFRQHRWISGNSIDDCTQYSDGSDIEAAYIQKERYALVHRSLGKLKSDYRQIIYLVYFEEFSNEEAGRIMGKSKRQIETMLYRAKNALRIELEKEGLGSEEL